MIKESLYYDLSHSKGRRLQLGDSLMPPLGIADSDYQHHSAWVIGRGVIICLRLYLRSGTNSTPSPGRWGMVIVPSSSTFMGSFSRKSRVSSVQPGGS